LIRFFRHIRQRLITDNKFSKYLLYAIGEILLVVIGILIALWANDWNDVQKEQIKRKALLNALSVEFNSNLNQLDSVMFYNDRVIDATLKIVDLKSNLAIVPSTDTLKHWLKNTSWLWTFNPQNGALRSGISSGDVHLIRSDSLITMLFSWQDVVADASENEKRHMELQLGSGSVVGPYVRMMDYYGLTYPKLPKKSEFTSDYQGLMRDPLFEDFITELYGHTVDAQNELNLVHQQNVNILQLVKQELNTLE
jgi:hypothetical protein